MTERWGMVIDVNRCVGCQTCTVACKHTNDTLPGVQWRRVLDVETGEFPDVERVFLVTGCQHCAEPPCVPVCPSGATKQREDGLVTMDYERCIGCAACAVACPYQARTIVHKQDWYYGEETIQERAVAHDDRLGVAQKCTFCVEKVDQAKELGLTAGVDPLVTPACAASCIASAIHFGDFADEASNVSTLVREGSSFQMHEELGTDPQIKYLYETPKVPGRDAGNADNSDELMADPSNPLVGEPQKFWDMRAAMNFILGGFGAGFVIVTYLLHAFAALSFEDLVRYNIIAGAIIAVGLFFVWLKIGRKLRAPFVILRPNSSWMSREVYAVGLLYVLGILNMLVDHHSLPFLTALAALLFLYCQVKILHASKGVPAWRVGIMPAMLLLAGLYEGTGVAALAMVVHPSVGIEPHSVLAVSSAILGLLSLVVWLYYVSRAKAHGIPPLARTVLLRITPIVLVAYVVPIAAYAYRHYIHFGSPTAIAITGIVILAGGAFWKSVVITRASHQQGFALAKWPQRGSGAFAAPSLVESGRA